ncbi:MAG: ABC transporter permease [Candidatus Melainabacteria bacterium]|jgi:ABC-2 type transport system permease protein
MRNIFTIASREFKSIVLTKTYIASILLVPIVCFATIAIAFSLQFINVLAKPNLPNVIIDREGAFSNFLLQSSQNQISKLNLEIYVADPVQMSSLNKSLKFYDLNKSQEKSLEKVIKQKIQKQQIAGSVEIPQDFAVTNKVIYISRNNLTHTLPGELDSLLNQFRLAKLGSENKITQEQIKKILEPIQVEAISIVEQNKKGKGKESSSIRLLAAAAIYGILSICIAIHGSKLTMSILEEKKTKIVEMLLSTVKPLEFMWGKILGSAAAAILQTGIWSVMLFFLFVNSGAMVFDSTAKIIVGSSSASALGSNSGQVSNYTPRAGTDLLKAGNFTNGIHEEASIEMLDNPHISANPELLIYLIIFAITGFLLYATLFAAVGAIASSVTEAQYLETPLVFLMMFPTYLFLPLIDNPNGPVIIASSFFPYFSPFVMYSRICVDQVPFTQIFISIVLLILAIVINVLLVSALYRGGVLLYGKKINFTELFNLSKNLIHLKKP